MRPTRLLVMGLLLLFIGTLMSGMVSAQRGQRQTPTPGAEGSGRGGGRGQRTPMATLAAPQGTPEGFSGRGETNPQATIERPSFSLTLPFEMSSSAEAEGAVNGFASAHLGTTYNLLYAGALTSSSLSPEAVAAIQGYGASLPAEVQSYINMIANGSGAAYWGVFQNGMGVVALANCADNPGCQVTQESITLYITSSSAGVYSVYTGGIAGDQNSALNMILAAYPGLNGLTFTPVTDTSQGYAFQAAGFSRSGTQAVTAVYYAGVVSTGGQSLVYAMVGVGEGYLGM
jgi:hypothetical protein